MALVKCPECGREDVSDTAEACPNCGFAIRDYFSKEAEESGVPVQPEESSNNEPSDKRRNKNPRPITAHTAVLKSMIFRYAPTASSAQPAHISVSAGIAVTR